MFDNLRRVRSPRPLYVWRIAFRLDIEEADPSALRDLELRLHTFGARVSLDGTRLIVRMRVVGHVGPASAIGDAAMMLGHHAANAGIEGSPIQVVHAERISATSAQAR